jgi:hypothetical protein
MTAYVSTSLGRLILANHLLAAIQLETPSTALLHYGSIKLKIDGKNLALLCEHLAAHRVACVRASTHLAPIGPDELVVENITLLKPVKKAASSPSSVAATPVPATV